MSISVERPAAQVGIRPSDGQGSPSAESVVPVGSNGKLPHVSEDILNGNGHVATLANTIPYEVIDVSKNGDHPINHEDISTLISKTTCWAGTAHNINNTGDPTTDTQYTSLPKKPILNGNPYYIASQEYRPGHKFWAHEVTLPRDVSKRQLPSALRNIRKVNLPGGGMVASRGILYWEGFYGRDSLISVANGQQVAAQAAIHLDIPLSYAADKELVGQVRALRSNNSVETKHRFFAETPEFVEANLLALARIQGREFQRERQFTESRNEYEDRAREATQQGQPIPDRKKETEYQVMERAQRYVKSAEEPGKIHHEYRSRNLRRERMSDEGEFIMHTLRRAMGGTEDEIRFYGTQDATGHFLTGAANHILMYPERREELLNEKFQDNNGKETTMRECLLKGMQWLEGEIDKSDVGLLEYFTQTHLGHTNPVWMDSDQSFKHPDNTLANHFAPIAALELQGVAYDAFKGMVKVFASDASHAEDVERWEEKAKELQRNVLERFWMPDEQFFALAIDRDENGEPRQVKLLSSDNALLLDTGIFDDLPQKEREMYVTGILNTLISEEFLTDAGIRCTAEKHNDISLLDENWEPIENFAAYHESRVTWIKQTFAAYKGAMRHGFYRVAEQFGNRILNAVNIGGENYEFFYITRDGEIVYDPTNTISDVPISELIPKLEVITGTNIPEGGQTWTGFGVYAIKRLRVLLKNLGIDPNSWQYEPENAMLASMKQIDVLRTREEIEEARPKRPVALIQVFARGMTEALFDQKKEARMRVREENTTEY